MLRVSILLYDEEDQFAPIEAELIPNFHQAGFRAEYASLSLLDLDMDPEKVAQFVTENPSDIWVIIGASRAVIEWFTKQTFPTMCLYGGFPFQSIAGIGPDHEKPLKQCIEQLIEFGHKRIVMYSRKDRRKPKLGDSEQFLLAALEANGIPADSHTLPDWEESLAGFRASLASLFEQASPTAIILHEPPFAMATMQFIKDQGITTPEKVSLFCADYADSIEWCKPQIAHSRWNQEKVFQRVLEWAKNVSNGKDDRAHSILDAEFIAGETIGPPPADDWEKKTEGKVW